MIFEVDDDVVVVLFVLFVSCVLIDVFCDVLWFEYGFVCNMFDVYWCDLVLFF